MKIAVLVSGGVDSSVALALLKQAGHDVTAFYLKIWLNDELSYLGACPWENDLAYVKDICAHLEVPFEVVSMQRQYHERVVAYVVDQVKQGLTPNPDVMCNKYIKFGLFLDIYGGSFDAVATGHYAQIEKRSNASLLLCAVDEVKDQTYFLCHLSQAQLQKTLFPIGHLTKASVREQAQIFNLATHDRKDSQGICFLGNFKFREFLMHHCGQQQGHLIEYETGIIVGKHEGFWFYTIGQRKDIRLAGGPWYVVAKKTEDNIVYISRSYYAADKERRHVHISSCHWIASSKPEDGAVMVKMRHGPLMQKATLVHAEDNKAQVNLALHDQGIAPGQFVVFYRDAVCLGGGVIDEPFACKMDKEVWL